MNPQAPSLPMPDRVTDIEEKVAFLERHVEELDAVVRDLYDKLSAIGIDVGRVRDDMNRGFEEIRRGPEDDVPPHWGGAAE